MEKNLDFIQRTGEFYTPMIWVKECHKFIEENIQDNLYNDYVVWDCAWGIGNLTKEYYFKELYVSTLLEDDFINNNNNNESKKFQFDFLNDDLEKLPLELIKSFNENKKIFILINPPYGTSNTAGIKSNHKSGTTKTIISKEMLDNNLDGNQQLFTQFLYRICKIKEKFNIDIKLGLFSPVNFLTGSSFIKFRKYFFNNFNYINGFIMKASEFDQVDSDWPLSFSIWESDINVNNNEFHFIIKDKQKDSTILNIRNKIVYNLDNDIKASDWIREYIKKSKTYPCVQLKSGLKIRDIKGQGRLVKNSFGYLVSGGNNVYKSKTDVYLLTSAYNLAHGISILSENFYDIISLFSGRIISTKISDWYSDRDEYLKPVIDNPLYKEWVYDSIVYSLFNNKSQQTSLRNINYQNEIHNIQNEFFWISKEKMIELSIKYNFIYLNNDAESSKNRYVYELLFGKEKIYDKLSDVAKEVLDLSITLVEKTFEYREILHNEKPEYYLNSWDAGWYQIKFILKKYYKSDYTIFDNKYKLLEERMKYLFNELKFLK